MDRAGRDEIGESSKKQRLMETPQSTSSVPIELLRGAVMPADRVHINSLHPDVVASQLMQSVVQFPALVDRLKQDCLKNRRNLESLEVVLDTEKAKNSRWEHLYKEVYSKMRIEQSEKEEAQSKIDELKEALKLMKCVKQKDSMKIQKLNEKVLDLVIENQELNVQNQQREKESLHARRELEEDSIKIRELNEKVHDLEIENRDLIVQNRRREDELEELEEELEEDSIKIQKLTEKVDNLEIENQKLYVQNYQREKEYLHAHNELEEDSIKIRKLNEKVHDLDTENKKLLLQVHRSKDEARHANLELLKSQSQTLQRDMIIYKLKYRENLITYEDEKACKQLMKEMNNKLKLITELHDAHTELISAMSDITSGSNIYYTVKRIGELDVEPFLNSCKLEFPPEEAEIKALQLRSSWQNHLSDVKWNPFKVTVNVMGDTEEVLNTNNQLLQNLKEIGGDEIYNAVTKALKELNECNPTDRCPVPTLWNSKEDRRATSAEVIRYLPYLKYRGMS